MIFLRALFAIFLVICCKIDATLIEGKYYSEKNNFSIVVPKAFKHLIQRLPSGEMNSDVVLFTDFLGSTLKVEVVTLKSPYETQNIDQLADFLSDYFNNYVFIPHIQNHPHSKIVDELTIEIKNGRVALLALIFSPKHSDEQFLKNPPPTHGMLTFINKNQLVTLTFWISPAALQILEISKNVSVNEKITDALIALQFGYCNETIK